MTFERGQTHIHCVYDRTLRPCVLQPLKDVFASNGTQTTKFELKASIK